jgi:hypothetical protein
MVVVVVVMVVVGGSDGGGGGAGAYISGTCSTNILKFTFNIYLQA